MAIVPEVANAMQSLLNEMAKKAAQECAAIKRQRKFSAQSLAQTFVLGFLANPNASDEDLAQMAGVVGVQVSTQAVEQRFSAELAEFLEIIFRRGLSGGCAHRCLDAAPPVADR